MEKSNVSNGVVNGNSFPPSGGLPAGQAGIEGGMIRIKGARVHNLKNISLDIPKNKMVVVTGVSGSGKSSLVFDTLYAEGHRRYVESLSSYARQFFGKMIKPDVDSVTGLSPAVAIEQKVTSMSSRSTVATSTEIYDYLKLLFARFGKIISPVSGREVKKVSVQDMADYVRALPAGTQVSILAPLIATPKIPWPTVLKSFASRGFTRVKILSGIISVWDVISGKVRVASKEIYLLVDRMVTDPRDGDFSSRLTDSLETANNEGGGECVISCTLNGKEVLQRFSSRLELDGIRFEESVPHLFTFNSPHGACRKCEGFGQVIGISEDLVIPDKSLSVYEGAVTCWKGEKMSEWKAEFLKNAHRFDFPVHKPYGTLSGAQKQDLWDGNEFFPGIKGFFEYVESQTYKIQYRVMLARFRGKTMCPDCRGSRLRKEALYVRVGGKTIHVIVSMDIKSALRFFEDARRSGAAGTGSERLMDEITSRLSILNEIGLGYLSLNRQANTLSGGETQRMNLSKILGSPLVGSIYILDEPSIGLHQRDTRRLINILKKLRDAGNSVIVVEHDEEIIRHADHIADLGPGAGSEGGEVLFSGPPPELLNNGKSITSGYLSGGFSIPVPSTRRNGRGLIRVAGAAHHNLKNITVRIPLNVMTVITGVSGSGKSTLVRHILYPGLQKLLGIPGAKEGIYKSISGDTESIKMVELMDRNPIGRSSRSNPVTYIKAFEEIRSLFADQPESGMKGFTPAYFSYNVDGGRCEQCLGDGEVIIEMQFLADIHLPCETCNGKRYKEEVLEVRYKGKNISDVLEMTVDEAIVFFAGNGNRIAGKLTPLRDVGLGYIRLGQPSGRLSGGEAQRIKLASYIGMGSSQSKTLFIFDEPTTGLHFHDIHKLLVAFDKLIENGHTLVVIEHNPEIIKCADWVIDLGPEGGDEGGEVIFEGTPEELIGCEKSYTSRYLKKIMQKEKAEK